MCAQCELLGREISQVESYLNQKDAEFNRLTEQLQDSQEQEAALRNELFRTNGELQVGRFFFCFFFLLMKKGCCSVFGPVEHVTLLQVVSYCLSKRATSRRWHSWIKSNEHRLVSQSCKGFSLCSIDRVTSPIRTNDIKMK